MSDPGRFFSDGRFTRRTALRYGGAAGAALAGASGIGRLLGQPPQPAPPCCARPTACPTPAARPARATEALPFDHVVVVMMENHSFDNLLGALAALGPAQGARPAL